MSDSASIEILEGIVSQFRKDGIFVNENIMRSIGINSASSNVETELELFEFRVGQILPLVTPQTAKTASGYPVLMHVQALGRSLKELLSAFEARDENHVAVAAICSILNALSFGGPERFHNCAKLSSVNSVLNQIVDYGDVDHICSVVNQGDNESLQQVCSEGLVIVERARTVEKDKSREESNGGTQCLVSVMGHLANGVTKLVRETTRLGRDGEAENHEAVTVLALIVTAKMIQMVEPVLELEAANTKNVKKECCTAFPSISEVDLTNSNSRPPTYGSGSSLTKGEGTSIAQRLSRLEDMVAFLVDAKQYEQNSIGSGRSPKHLAGMVEKLIDMVEKVDDRTAKLEKILG